MPPFTAGDRLGPYEIVGPIGAGGMGMVYKARETRLGRDVAIKISNEKFTDRFEREARSIAALNHPTICQLYDVGPDFLVMELVARKRCHAQSARRAYSTVALEATDNVPHQAVSRRIAGLFPDAS